MRAAAAEAPASARPPGALAEATGAPPRAETPPLLLLFSSPVAVVMTRHPGWRAGGVPLLV